MIHPPAKIKNLYTVLMIFLLMPGTANTAGMVVGYYPSWKWYDRNKLVGPETIDYSKYSIINYAFFRPRADGTIVNGDAHADEILLKGSSVNGKIQKSLVSEARRHGSSVLISVGGWTWSEPFSVISASSATRERFADECSRIIDEYGVDGIDIDWEFPGYIPHGGSPADRQNFTLLLRGIREKFDSMEAENGRKLLLTIAAGPSLKHIESVDWPEVLRYVDIINVMSYNYSGAWEKSAGHHTPLYDKGKRAGLTSVESSISYLINECNVPADKLTLGVAFYGRSVLTIDQPVVGTHTRQAPDDVTFRKDRGSPEYYSLCEKLDLFERHWDAGAQVPYLTGKNGLKTFVTYDDPVSVAAKTRFALKTGMKGVAIWEITGDYLLSGEELVTPLADAIIFEMNAYDLMKEEQNYSLNMRTRKYIRNITPGPEKPLILLSFVKNVAKYAGHGRNEADRDGGEQRIPYVADAIRTRNHYHTDHAQIWQLPDPFYG